MFQIKENNSYKIGIEEIPELKSKMIQIMKPVLKALNKAESWSGDNWFKLETVEYTRRDGFIPHSHNCGGIQINSVIPKCGEYDFSWINFGEHDEDCAYNNGDECDCGESDGLLDASLRIWFKFEGLDENGIGSFYLVVAGGNGDAPYFRHKYENTYFEASFEASNLIELEKNASKPIGDVIRLIKKG